MAKYVPLSDCFKVMKENTIEAYDYFLEKYPKGKRAKEIRTLKEKMILRQKAAQAEQEKIKKYWTEANNIGTIKGYNDFLLKFRQKSENIKSTEYEDKAKDEILEISNKLYGNKFLGKENTI